MQQIATNSSTQTYPSFIISIFLLISSLYNMFSASYMRRDVTTPPPHTNMHDSVGTTAAHKDNSMFRLSRSVQAKK